MPRNPIKVSVDRVVKNGLTVLQWTKRCPICGKEYTTQSRKQRYCSDACCKKAQKRHRRQQKEYSETKEIVRLSSRSHSVGVEVLNQLHLMGLRVKQCECCGTTESLQCHHKDLNWLNNTPSNLQWLCPACHSKVHSELKDTPYDESFLPILSVLNKNCND